MKIVINGQVFDTLRNPVVILFDSQQEATDVCNAVQSQNQRCEQGECVATLLYSQEDLSQEFRDSIVDNAIIIANQD